MYLHESKDLFAEIVQMTSNDQNIPVPVVEKDYYVTMILRLLSESEPDCVFKGGTSLSKGYHVIDRFSEDIDISFTEKLTAGRRKKLKNRTIAGIQDQLNLPIVDWENARSRRDYNKYTFSYQPVSGFIPESMVQGVKMEISLGAPSFPAESLSIDSYIWRFLQKENREIAESYLLSPFSMNVQSLERTLIDKIFAVCDYYLQGRLQRNSRHLYDIYMILPHVQLDESFAQLFKEIRLLRSAMAICPSAKEEVSISNLLQEILERQIYKEDYQTITAYFQHHPLEYDQAMHAIQKLIESGAFDPE